MLGLLLLGRNHIRNCGTKIVLKNIPLSIHQYLYRMDFFKQEIFNRQENLSEQYFLKRSAMSKNLVEISPIPNKERESIKAISSAISVFRKRANFIMKHWLSDTIVDFFVTVISEICQNIYEHSLDSGYLAMQSYSYANQKIVRLAVSDSGIGIRESFAKSDIKYNSPAQLIQLALTTTISSKREFGYGLNQVNAIIEKLGGSIFIRSENAAVSVMYNARKKTASHSFLKNDIPVFPGTQISISLTA
jgi:anti-sigma regulatory factor (Ser/Thr protein kinase)